MAAVPPAAASTPRASARGCRRQLGQEARPSGSKRGACSVRTVGCPPTHGRRPRRPRAGGGRGVGSVAGGLGHIAGPGGGDSRCEDRCHWAAPPLSCPRRGPEQAPRERGCDTPRWPPRCGLGCEAAGGAWQGPRPQGWPLLTDPWLSEPGGLTDKRRVPSQTGQGWEAEQRPCGVLTGEHPAGSPCVWREPPPSHPHSTHSDPHSEHHLFRDFPGRALGGGTSLECLEPQTRRAQSHGPHGREPLVCPRRPAVRPYPHQRRLRPLCSLLSAVQENNSPHKDPFISAPRCSPTPYLPTARGQSPHVASGANQGSAADLSGREQLRLVSSRTGRLWVWPGACHTPGAAFPRQQGLGLRGRRGRTG